MNAGLVLIMVSIGMLVGFVVYAKALPSISDNAIETGHISERSLLGIIIKWAAFIIFFSLVAISVMFFVWWW